MEHMTIDTIRAHSEEFQGIEIVSLKLGRGAYHETDPKHQNFHIPKKPSNYRGPKTLFTQM